MPFNRLQQHQTKDSGEIQSKNRQLMIEIKLEKRENRMFSQNHFAFTLSNLLKHFNMLWFYKNDSNLNATFSAFTKTTDTFNKH